MDQRDENILVTLSERFAPSLLAIWDRRGTFDERLPRLARGLASYNILVLMADEPYSLLNIHQNMGTLIQEWANHYADFYRRLCQDLFPSFNQISVHGTDNRWPIIVYLQGTATPVIQRMAGFVAPYIVERQFNPTISEVELVGLMDLVLDELEAGNLSREAYKQLRSDCVEILKRLLETPVHQLPVTDFDREIFSDSRRFVPPHVDPPPTIPENPPSRLPPVTQPPPPIRQADTEQLMPTDIMPTPPKDSDVPKPALSQPKENSGFSLTNTFAGLRRDKENGKKPRPPVPPLPNTDEKD